MATFHSNPSPRVGYRRPPIFSSASWYPWGTLIALATTNNWQLSTVNLYLANLVNSGSPPGGTLTLTLYDASGNGPTGSALSVGTLDQSAIATITGFIQEISASGALYAIPMLPAYTMLTGNSYALTIEANAGSATSATIIYQNLTPQGTLFATYAITNTLIKAQSGVWTTGGGVTYLGSALCLELLGTEIIPRDPERPDADTITFPSTRPDAYDPDQIWDPGQWVGDVYTDPEWAAPGAGRYFATGGGRWNQQLVVVSESNVYYEALT